MEQVLVTQRLRLRTLVMDDLDFVAAMLGHAEVMHHYPKQYTREESRQWIERQLVRYLTDGHGLWLVEDLATGEPLGQIGLIMQTVDGERIPEVGYLLHYPYWHRGFAVEAARGVRDYAYTEMDYPFVISLIRPRNTPSQAVAQKLGMKVWKHCQHGGYLHDVYRYDFETDQV